MHWVVYATSEAGADSGRTGAGPCSLWMLIKDLVMATPLLNGATGNPNRRFFPVAAHRTML